MSPIKNIPDEDMTPIEKPTAQRPAIRGVPQPPAEIIANHTVKEGETLSHLSLKYYGSAHREAWIIIYEANKDVLKGTPEKFVMYPGQVLKIPKRPA